MIETRSRTKVSGVCNPVKVLIELQVIRQSRRRREMSADIRRQPSVTEEQILKRKPQDVGYQRGVHAYVGVVKRGGTTLIPPALRFFWQFRRNIMVRHRLSSMRRTSDRTLQTQTPKSESLPQETTPASQMITSVGLYHQFSKMNELVVLNNSPFVCSFQDEV